MPLPKPTLFIRLTHTGLYADGRPNLNSVLITDLDVGYENQLRKVAVYVPAGGFIDIPASSRSLLAFYEGVISQFVKAGLITATLFFIPESYTTAGLPPASNYPAGAFVWNTTDSAPNWSDGASWTAGMSGPAGGDLDGTYPNPTVIGLEGIPIEAPPPSNGDTLIYNSFTNEWEHTSITFGGGPPSGPAGGDLVGLYPNPDIAAGVVTHVEVAAANKDGLAAVPSMRTLGTGALQAAAGNDARLSDARTPTAHAPTHLSTGTDPIDWMVGASPVLAGLDGLVPQPLAGEDALFLRGDGTWAAVTTPPQSIVEITGTSYAVGVTDEVVLVNQTADAPVALTLPAGATHATGHVVVKDKKGTADVRFITVSASGLETIDGQGSLVLDNDYVSCGFVFFGTEWSAV